MKLKINRAGVRLIKSHEGLRLRVYKDSAGFATIGYGHKLKPEEELRLISEAQATLLLRADIGEAERAIDRIVKVKLNTNQFSALVSWVFNLGSGALSGSTLLKRLNEGDFVRTPGEMLRWVIAGGVPLKGLILRRAAEASLFIRR